MYVLVAKFSANKITIAWVCAMRMSDVMSRALHKFAISSMDHKLNSFVAEIIKAEFKSMAKWVSATHIYMHKTGSKNLQSCLKQRWQCQCGVARADHDQEEHDAAGEVDGSKGGGREVGGREVAG